MNQETRIKKDIKMFEENISKTNKIDIKAIKLAKQYYEDSKYYLDKKDLFTAFGCINYAHGLLDANIKFQIQEGVIIKINGNMDGFYKYSYPTQAVLVTCNDKKGKTNVITLGWHSTISKKPPLYGICIAPRRYSHDLIANSKEYNINFVPYMLVEKVNFCGTHTGKKTDKIKETDLTLEKVENIQTPIIKECYAHLICKLSKTFQLGDHSLFVGKVLKVLFDEQAFSNDLLNNDKIKPCYYLGDNNYTTLDNTRKRF